MTSIVVNTGFEYCVLRTRDGYMLKFKADDVPLLKKNSIGVHGIKLTRQDVLAQAYLTGETEGNVILVGERQFDSNQLKTAGRGGRGAKPKS